MIAKTEDEDKTNRKKLNKIKNTHITICVGHHYAQTQIR
jgi:hypothetical protein